MSDTGSEQHKTGQHETGQTGAEETVTVYDGRIVRLEVTDGKWEVVRHKDAVAILALDEQGRMLCVRQTRRATGGFTLEAPAGLIEDGEDPMLAARRELQEEAGLDGQMELLTRFYPSPGFCDEALLVFRATELTESRLPMDDDEDIVVEWHHPAALLAGLRDGSVVGAASTVTAALFALQALAAPQERAGQEGQVGGP